MLTPHSQKRSIKKLEEFGKSTIGMAASGDGNAACATRIPDVSVSIGELLPPLLTAIRENRRWVDDFQHDLITIPADLYEMIRESIRMRSDLDSWGQ